METVMLKEITAETVRQITDLSVTETQTQFVASNAVSIAQAYFSEDAWFRAIYAGETPVGFVMLSVVPEKGEYFVWRFMIDQHHQGKGYGRAALQLIIDHVKTLPNADALYLSYVPAEGNPGPFYRSLGFEETGEVEYGERVMKLDLI